MSVLLRACLLALSGLLLSTAPAIAAPPPIAAFFKRPDMQSPTLSPNGRYLAILTAGKVDRLMLAVIDLQTMAPPKVVAAFADADVMAPRWVNDERLVFQASNSTNADRGSLPPGLWGVNRDGNEFRHLIQSEQHWETEGSGQIKDRRLDANWRLFGTLRDGSDDVLVLRYPWLNDGPDSTSVRLARLDTRTSRVKEMSQGLPPYVGSWTVDWRGEPRAVTAESKGHTTIYKRDDQGAWKPWQEGDSLAFDKFTPYWFGPDGLTLVKAQFEGRAAVFRLDPKTQQPEAKPLLAFDGYDYNGTLEVDPVTGRLLGVHYETDAPGTVWFAPEMKAFQADVDAKLRGTVNHISCSRCLGAPFFVITAQSDQAPPRYWLYKTADKNLQPLTPARADLPIREMGQRDVVRFKARDGLEIPLLVTMPPGPKKGRPAVLMVHGGPNVRGAHWAWDDEAQFLASRGYVVLEPEFRGSKGYGYAHYRAGWRQWGLAMQDDLADTVAFAVKQGWVDPDRVCIAGASYGGYAALMGAIKQADIFKCAINWVGVTDLGLIDSIHWSDASDDYRSFGMKRLVGDPVADADQFAATSPLKRAREIKIPLLMAYGQEDVRVPLKHGTDLKAAMSSSQPLEWAVYAKEGHGWFNLKTNEDFWGRVERFLGKHLAPAN